MGTLIAPEHADPIADAEALRKAVQGHLHITLFISISNLHCIYLSSAVADSDFHNQSAFSIRSLILITDCFFDFRNFALWLCKIKTDD